MRPWWVVLSAIAVLGFSLSLGGQVQQPSTPQGSAGEGGCQAYFTIEPLDQSVLTLLGTTAVPPRQTPFINASFQQLRDWDFPSKVTRWSERPSPEELARRREELIKPSPAEISRAYDLQPLSPGDWKDLEKWFGREAAKRFPGACVDREKATYILKMGVISDGSADRSMSNSSTRNEYNQTAGVRRQDSSLGPNAATTSPVAHESTAQELSGMSSSSDSSRPGAYTCAYLYRTSGGTKRSTPDFYYCKADSVMPRSAATAMLKYLAKAGLP